jgi:hypothetical protein
MVVLLLEKHFHAMVEPQPGLLVRTSHYRKDGLCRAPKDLPGAFYRAHDKGYSFPCAYATPHDSDKRTV